MKVTCLIKHVNNNAQWESIEEVTSLETAEQEIRAKIAKINSQLPAHKVKREFVKVTGEYNGPRYYYHKPKKPKYEDIKLLDDGEVVDPFRSLE